MFFWTRFKSGFVPFTFFCTLLFSILSWTFPAFAEYDNDLQNWSTVYFTGESKHIKAFGEIQNRTGLGAQPLPGEQYLFLRGAVSYRLTKGLALGQGYAWAPGFQPRFFSENRIFQQLEYEHKFKKLTLSNRTRLEERFIKNVDGTALRVRHKIEAKYPLGKSKKWAAVVSDEFFFNLNTPEVGNINFEEARPKRGFDQNRTFVGVSRKINDRLEAEAGYMLRYNNEHGSGARDLLDHIIVLTLTVKAF